MSTKNRERKIIFIVKLRPTKLRIFGENNRLKIGPSTELNQVGFLSQVKTIKKRVEISI